MAVDLVDLVPYLKATVNPPGSDLFSTTTNNEWSLRLENAFWHARLDGLFTSFRAIDGLVEPITTGDDDMSRELQQLLILYAGLDIVLAELRNAQSAFRAKAGPVEYETQQSAPLLREVLNTIKARIKEVIDNLSSYAGEASAFDAVIARTEAMAYRDVWWVR